MNESLDLRNRILKMRENNNLVLDEFKSKSKTTITSSEIIPEKTKSVSNSREVNFDAKLEKETSPVESKIIENSNFLKKESAKSNIKNSENSNNQASDNLVYDNEAQFRIIARKFNEAVEVILELSDKVKILEETVHDLSVKPSKSKNNGSFFNLKNFVLIIIISFIFYGMFTLPIDLTLIKLIITDVISSI